MAIFQLPGIRRLTLLTVDRDVAPSDLGASGRPVLPSPGAGARRRAGGRGDPAAYRGPFAAGADWPRRPDRLSRLGERRDDVAKEAPEGVEGLGGSSSVDDVRRCARNHPATRDRPSHSRGPGRGSGVEADRGVDREKLGSRLTRHHRLVGLRPTGNDHGQSCEGPVRIEVQGVPAGPAGISLDKPHRGHRRAERLPRAHPAEDELVLAVEQPADCCDPADDPFLDRLVLSPSLRETARLARASGKF